MTQYRRYDDVSVGDQFPPTPLSFLITDDAVDAFLAATEDTGTAYMVSDGKRRAPSMLAAVYLVDLLKARASPPGGIHAKQSIRFFRPLVVGEEIGIQAKVTEKYQRKDRPYIVSDFEARDRNGSLVSSGRITSIWGKDT